MRAKYDRTIVINKLTLVPLWIIIIHMVSAIIEFGIAIIKVEVNSNELFLTLSNFKANRAFLMVAVVEI